MSESIKQLGYKFASSLDSGRAVARELYRQFPTLPDGKLEPEVKAELIEAFQLRYAENNPNIEVKYVLREGQFMPVASGEKLAKDAETINMSVSFAMSESAQKFGQMRTSEDARQKALYSVIKPVRDAVNKYTSNTFNTLVRYAKEIANEGQPRSRGATLDFDAWIKKVLLDAKTKVKAASARGDETADAALLDKATVAFLTVWNHQK